MYSSLIRVNMKKIKTSKKMEIIISHSVGSIVVKSRSKEVDKYDVTKYISEYKIVREMREEADEEVVNVEWYVESCFSFKLQ